MEKQFTDGISGEYSSDGSKRDCTDLDTELEMAQQERANHQCQFKIAQINDACQEKISEFEHELNKQGYWNIALVAYQKDC